MRYTGRKLGSWSLDILGKSQLHGDLRLDLTLSQALRHAQTDQTRMLLGQNSMGAFEVDGRCVRLRSYFIPFLHSTLSPSIES